MKRDFVELPSQVMENWCYEPEFLNTFARHYQTGATIPLDYIQKIRAAEKYLAGWLCVRQLSLGLADFGFHTITKPIEGPIEDFERLHMKELLPETGYIRGGCSPIGMKKPLPTFVHESALLYDYIYVSAGVRGLQIASIGFFVLFRVFINISEVDHSP